MKKRFLSILMALVLALSLLPVSALAAGGTVAKIGDIPYDSLKAAVAAVPAGGTETTILLMDNIVMTTDDIVTVAEGQNIILDMDEHSITVQDDFKGRPIVNEGTLTVTGNGTIDSTTTQDGGLGAINNKGVLTIENGTYRGDKYASGACIRNTGAGASLTIKDGTFEKATCAVYNEGTAVIYKGNFSNESCSSCAKVDGHENMWSYTIRNVTKDSKMTIYGGEFISTQGAVSAAIGSLTVNGGYFKTVDCERKHGAIFYALYAAGEVGEVETVINGGTFETTGKNAAVSIGNDNKGDGGINAQSAAEINGGTFIAPEGVPAVKRATETGNLVITGGTFTSGGAIFDVSEYLADTCVQDENGAVVELSAENATAQVGNDYYKTLADAIAAAEDGETVKLLKETSISEAITIEKNITLDLNTLKVTSTYAASEGQPTYSLTTKGNITIKNGTYVLDSTNTSTRGIAQNSGNLTLEGVTVSCNGQVGIANQTAGGTLTIKDSVIAGGYAVAIFQNSCTVNISGSEITGTSCGFYHNGSNYGLDLTMSDTVVTCENNLTGILISGSTTTTENNGGKNHQVKLTNCTVSGGTAVEVKYTDLTVEGCTLTATAENAVYKQNANGGATYGFAVVITDNAVNGTSPKPSGKISINGGTYTGLVGLGSFISKDKYTEFAEADYAISGGSFSKIVPEEYCAPGFVPVAEPDADGNYTVQLDTEKDYAVHVQDGNGQTVGAYETLAEALAGAQSGDTVRLMDDVDSAAALTIPGGVTLDGNGFSINYTGARVEADKPNSGAFLTVNADADGMTIRDVIINAGENIRHGVQFYCADSCVLENVTVNGGAWTSVMVNGAQDVTVKDSILNPEEGAYATIEYGMGSGVTTIPSVELENVTSNGDIVVWVDNDTVTRVVDADGSDHITTAEEAADVILEKITTTNNDSITVMIQVSSEAGAAPETVVKPSTKPAPSGGSSVTRYEVAVAETENGAVTVSPQRAARGRTVTITATPDEGYEVASVTVTGSDGSAVEVADKGDGKFTFTMPRGKVEIEASFKAVEEEPQPSGLPFTDVAEGDWYYDAVSYAYENGLMTGTSATLFAPGTTTSRAMLATLLWRLEGEPAVTGAASFTDVAAGTWYTDAVAWAASEGVVNGVGDGSAFAPNDTITREQMAVMLYRYAQYKDYDVTQGGMAAREYADYESISSWAVPAVEWAVNAGLISGTSATTLSPQGSATRAEIATILMRFVEAFVPAE